MVSGVDKYFTPFYRINKSGVFEYEKELKFSSEMHLIPQVLTNSVTELLQFARNMIDRGFFEINLNIGCPFPMVANRHLGSGLLPYTDEINTMLQGFYSEKLPIQLSVKSRLGWSDQDDILVLLQVLSDFPVNELILHPRLGVQKYKGEPDWIKFQDVLEACPISLIGNGDINSLSELNAKKEQFPQVKGWMLGRGLLTNPALLHEQNSALEVIDKLHDLFYNNLLEFGYAEGQMLNHLRCFWEYPSQLFEGGMRIHRKMKKVGKMEEYWELKKRMLDSEL